MGRRDHARALGEPVEHGRVGIDTDLRMQEEQGPAVSLLDGLDANTIDLARGERGVCQHGDPFCSLAAVSIPLL